jgi:fucose permease
LHATFSAGSIVGAGAVALALAAGLGFRSLYAALAVGLVVMAVAFILPVRSLDRLVTGTSEKPMRGFRPAFRLGRIRLCALLTGLSFGGEIVVADWTSIYLRDERDVSGSFAAACIVAFGIAMFLGRVLNGPMIRLLGVRSAIALQGAVTAAGGALIVAEGTALLAMAGCALTGFGVAGVGPTALSVAGIALPDDPASAAGVTLAGGYIGLAGMPVVSGLIADGISTRVTLSLVIVIGLAIAVAAMGMPRRIYQGS